MSMPSPASVLSKAIRVPSGDRCGVRSVKVSDEKSYTITSIPPRLSCRLKASFLPSGDQSGCALPHVLRVIGVAFVPSAFITQMSHDPDRWLANAIFMPSGDNAGQRLGETSFVTRVVWLPSAFAR